MTFDHKPLNLTDNNKLYLSGAFCTTTAQYRTDAVESILNTGINPKIFHRQLVKFIKDNYTTVRAADDFRKPINAFWMAIDIGEITKDSKITTKNIKLVARVLSYNAYILREIKSQKVTRDQSPLFVSDHFHAAYSPLRVLKNFAEVTDELAAVLLKVQKKALKTLALSLFKSQESNINPHEAAHTLLGLAIQATERILDDNSDLSGQAVLSFASGVEQCHKAYVGRKPYKLFEYREGMDYFRSGSVIGELWVRSQKVLDDARGYFVGKGFEFELAELDSVIGRHWNRQARSLKEAIIEDLPTREICESISNGVDC